LNDIAAATFSGYEVLTSAVLPPGARVDGYYDILGPRARALLGHPDQATRDFAAETVREIEIFDRSEGSNAFVFHVLQWPSARASAIGRRRA
jgi:hypothetical protein